MVIRRSLSGKNGFWFNRLKLGRYLLYGSYIGYRDTILSLSLKAGDTLLNIGTIWLQSAVRFFVEVVVKAIIPSESSKSDTLVYDAAAFKIRPNTTVEELLKKITRYC